MSDDNGQGKVQLTDDDWLLLLPVKSVTLGKTVIEIRPLGLEDFGSAVERISTLRKEITEAGVTMESYSKGEGLRKFAKVLVEKLPDVISDAANLSVEDIKKLPMSAITNLVGAVLDANIESQEGLLKNFGALAGKVTKLMGSVSVTSPSSLSRQDTDGSI